jgi:SAM-dependent methyltransferase
MTIDLEDRVEIEPELNEELYWKVNCTYKGRIKDTFHRFPELAAGSRILDWGCCNGETTDELQEHYSDSVVFGIDVSPGNIAQARAEKRKGVFLVADGYHLPNSSPFCDESFDAVYCMNNITQDEVRRKFDKHYKQILQRITRLVKPGGYFCVARLEDYVVLRKTSNGFVLEDSGVVIQYINSPEDGLNLSERNPVSRIAFLLSGDLPKPVYVQIPPEINTTGFKIKDNFGSNENSLPDRLFEEIYSPRRNEYFVYRSDNFTIEHKFPRVDFKHEIIPRFMNKISRQYKIARREN